MSMVDIESLADAKRWKLVLLQQCVGVSSNPVAVGKLTRADKLIAKHKGLVNPDPEAKRRLSLRDAGFEA